MKSCPLKAHIDKFEINETAEETADKENRVVRRNGKVTASQTAVISGLKVILMEQAEKLVKDVTEDFFNIDAKPFTPKAARPAAPIDMLKPAVRTSSSDPAMSQLEKKRQVAQMYQYYNYLIFEKNKESFNDINPDLRKMTYKYDDEVKNSYMTVQASPEVIKAAMGMNVHRKEPAGKGAEANTEADEPKMRKYTRDQVGKIFAAMDRDLKPAMELVDCPEENRGVLQELLGARPKTELRAVLKV